MNKFFFYTSILTLLIGMDSTVAMQDNKRGPDNLHRQKLKLRENAYERKINRQIFHNKKRIESRRTKNIQKGFQFYPQVNIHDPRYQIFMGMLLMSSFVVQANAYNQKPILSSNTHRHPQNLTTQSQISLLSATLPICDINEKVNEQIVSDTAFAYSGSSIHGDAHLLETPKLSVNYKNQPFPFTFSTPEINENARALKESIDCGIEVYKNRRLPASDPSKKYNPCLMDVMQRWPNYNEKPDIVKSFYEENIEAIGGGGSNAVYAVTLKQDRNNVSCGIKIALRLLIQTQQRSGLSIPPFIMAYSQLVLLKNYNKFEISEFYPDIYGVYFGPDFPSFKPGSPHFDEDGNLINFGKDLGMLYTEMEFVDTFFDREYRNNKIPDNVIFEQCFGEWATKKISKIIIEDEKVRHYGLKEVKHYRAYHIGKEIYLFNPGKTPKRVDLDQFYTPTEEEIKKKYKPKFTSVEEIASENAREAFERMGDEGIFNVFSKYFSKYKVSAQHIINHHSQDIIKHYFVPEEYLDNM